MDIVSLLRYFNFALVSIFGILLSTQIAGGWNTKGQKHLVFALCPIFILIQGVSCWLFGVEYTHKLYPVIVHLPLILTLIFALKKPVFLTLGSVTAAYLCCQLPNWGKMALLAVTNSQLLSEISYSIIIFPFYYLLHRYFAPTAYATMTHSVQTLVLFCSLPFSYYLFDYAAVIYSNALYEGIPILVEFFPTALIVFYIIFLTAYHTQSQKQMESDLQRSLLEAELEQAGAEIKNLRHQETQAAIYRHDLRHHLTAIDGFLASGNLSQAQAYIKQVCSDVESITPACFCDNELVNLLCSSFSAKAKSTGVRLSIDAKLPKQLSIPDTELCALLSNGLENALRAAQSLDVADQWVKLYCGVRANKLLIEIKNPYAGKIELKDGLPISKRTGHGFGLQSIQNIVNRHRGLSSFETNDHGIFTLRVVIPLLNVT